MPAGCQDGQTLVLTRKGSPLPGSQELGDHIVRIKIAIPTELSQEQREALERYKKVESPV